MLINWQHWTFDDWVAICIQLFKFVYLYLSISGPVLHSVLITRRRTFDEIEGATIERKGRGLCWKFSWQINRGCILFIERVKCDKWYDLYCIFYESEQNSRDLFTFLFFHNQVSAVGDFKVETGRFCIILNLDTGGIVTESVVVRQFQMLWREFWFVTKDMDHI